MMKFEKIRERDLEKLLKWRVAPKITRYMLTDIPYDMALQRQWYERVQKDPCSKYWMIHFGNREIGLANLSDIDFTHRRCSW